MSESLPLSLISAVKPVLSNHAADTVGRRARTAVGTAGRGRGVWVHAAEAMTAAHGPCGDTCYPETHRGEQQEAMKCLLWLWSPVGGSGTLRSGSKS